MTFPREKQVFYRATAHEEEKVIRRTCTDITAALVSIKRPNPSGKITPESQVYRGYKIFDSHPHHPSF